MIHEDMRSFYNGFPRDAHPMAILGSVVGALSTFYQDSLDPHDGRLVEISVHRLMAKLPTIAAYSYKKSIGQPFVYPQNSLSYSANFLNMMFSVPAEPYEIDDVLVRAPSLDKLLDCLQRLFHRKIIDLASHYFDALTHQTSRTKISTILGAAFPSHR